MNILVTGAAGFVGKNLVESLKNIKDGKDRTVNIPIESIDEFDIGVPDERLDEMTRRADFVFNLAGVNRPEDSSEYMRGNFGFAAKLLGMLEKHNNTCPVMLASSVQATLYGRYADSEYGKSKLAGEELFFKYAAHTGARPLVYRLPNLFGKWCRPNYNSAVATFCHNIANDLPITVSNPNVRLQLLYIDDLIAELIGALQGLEHRCEYDKANAVFCENGRYCCCAVTHEATLAEIVEMLYRFKAQPQSLLIPPIPRGSLEKKLYSTYLSYLPPEKAAFDLNMKSDERGSFTELLKTDAVGQFSVNISNPGVTKGQHWHHSKWEIFIVVSGRGLIRQRRIGSDETTELEVSGEKITAVQMLPGYTHSLVNLSDTQKLITLMWANEQFEPERPDTFFEEV